MSVRIHLDPDQRHATIHIAPNWLERALDLLRVPPPRDYEVWRIREMGARFVWVTHDNRPVARRVADAIERAVTKRGGGTLRLARGGR